MTQIMQCLLALQKLELETKPLTLEHKAEILKLREKVPELILGHFDRLIARGKKGVAITRDGVCSECHLRVTSGMLASLVYTAEIHVCDNCGRYLYLPEEEPLGLADSLGRRKLLSNHRPVKPTAKATVHGRPPS